MNKASKKEFDSIFASVLEGYSKELGSRGMVKTEVIIREFKALMLNGSHYAMVQNRIIGDGFLL